LPAIITFFCVHAVADDNRRAEKGITPIYRYQPDRTKDDPVVGFAK